jgi:phospholipid/cholesterol/gamma-HCH transport system substrate-binding protein
MTTLTRLGRFAGTATPVVDNLTSVTRQATPVLADLRPAAQATRGLVQELPGALRVAKPLLGQLTPFAHKLTPAVASLSDTLRQGDPLLSYLGPYAQEFGAFFADNGGAIGQSDSAGYFGRVFPIFADSSFTGTSTILQNAIDQLDGISQAQAPLTVKVNAYPKPGTNGAPQPFSGNYPRLLPLAPTPARSYAK